MAAKDSSDQETLALIHRLVDEEHRLRQQISDGDSPQELGRLHAVETQLDQCWDLLRQRRALRDAGSDPAAAAVRPAEEVEGYLS